MASRVARIWNGTAWEEISPQVISPSIIASYQANEPSSPITGQLWVESDVDVDVFSTQIIVRWSKTLSGSESSFSGLSGGVLLEYTAGFEQVYLNGILLLSGTDYTATDGTTVVLTTAGQSGDVIEIISPNTLSIANTYTTSQVDTSLALKANLASPALTGIPTAPTASVLTNTTQIATTAFVRTEVSNLVASAPATLDTLNELATALGNDPNFATTVTNSLSTKAPLASPTFTGTVTLPSSTSIGNVSATELGYLDGVTSSIQSQLSNIEAIAMLGL